jgi:hypothetical protein
MLNFLFGVLIGFAIAYYVLTKLAARLVILSTVDILQKIADSEGKQPINFKHEQSNRN